jgi:hypothetical protein
MMLPKTSELDRLGAFMRKRRTRQHVIADLSVHHVEGLVLRCGWRKRLMIARSTVTFDELRQLLLGLGFTQSKRGKFWFFAHAPSECVLGFRPYRPRERVTVMDVHMTRRHLDLRGVLEGHDFDDMLKKATA